MPPLPQEPTVLAGRYRLGRLLGTGAHGVVHEAHDLLTDAVVAVKLLWLPEALRREATALRRLRVPGVVQMLDEGVDRGRTFLVMERIEGEEFPPAGPAPWSQVAPGLASLLEALDAIHAAGAVHLDLKPPNLLQTPDGRVIVLDLGLARFDPGPVGGNRRYAAPEQLSGGQVDGRADLYAVAAMVHEALAGDVRAPLPADVPAYVADTLRETLAPDPGARPRDAAQLAHRLRLEPAPITLPAGPMPRALWDLFVGPERVLHLRSDAANLALQAAEGRPEAVPAVLESWRRRGLAVRVGDRFHVSRDALDRLADATNDSSAAPLDERVAHLVARGRNARALAACADAMRTAVDPAAREMVARRWLLLAISAGFPAALDPALHALGRIEASPSVSLLERIGHAARLTVGGEGARALAELHALPGSDDPEVALCVATLRVQAAGKLGPEAEEAELAQVARLPIEGVAGRFDRWLGRLRYAQGRFAEAARLQERAVRRATTPVAYLFASLDVASAWLELGHWREALEQAHAALRRAADARMPLQEARAEWLLRAIAYRSDRFDDADLELVEATRALSLPYLEGLVALNEAAVTWRLGRDPFDLAASASAAFRRGGQRGGAALADALRVAAGAGDPEPVWAEALAHPVADLDWQIAGLLAMARPDGPWTERARVGAAAAPRLSLRRDILAPDEVLRNLSQPTGPAPSRYEPGE